MKKLLMLFILLLLLPLALQAEDTPYDPQLNLLTNPDFEEGNWEGSGTIVQTAKTGKRALALEANGKSATSAKFALNPHMDYYFSIWYKGENLQKSFGTGIIELYLPNGSKPKDRLVLKGAKMLKGYHGPSFHVAGNTGWQHHLLYFSSSEIPDDCTFACLKLYTKSVNRKGADGEALFDNIYFGPAKATLDLTIKQDGKVSPAFLIDKGKPAELEAGVYIPAMAQKPATGELVITDYFGKKVTQQNVTGTYDANGGIRVKIPVDSLPIGYYLTEFRSPNGIAQKRAFGVIDPALNTAQTDPESPYGLNIRGFYSPFVFEIVQRLGFKWFRGGPNSARWSSVEPEKGKFNFEPILAEKAFLKKYGILRIERMQSYPKWAQQKIDGGISVRQGRQYRDRASRSFPADVGGWKRYCEETARALAPAGPNYFELWNEPAGVNNWMDTNEKFIELVKITHEALKKGDPNAFSVMCGLQGSFLYHTQDRLYPSEKEVWRTVNPRKFFNMLMEAGEYMDVLNFHSYGGYDTISQKMRFFEEARKKHPFLKGKELWITETGNNTGRVLPPECKNAQVYVKTHVIARSFNKSKVFWFSGINTGRDPDYSEHNFGMMHVDLMPKPTVFAHTALVGILGKGTFVEKADLGKEVNAFVYNNNGPLTIAWSKDPQLTIIKSGQPLKVKNIMGNDALTVPWGNGFLAEISADPIYIMQDGLNGKNIGTPLQPQQITIRPSSSVQTEVVFTNPGEIPLSHTVNFHAPEGITLSPNTCKVNIKAHSQQAVTLSIANKSLKTPGMKSILMSVDTTKRQLYSGLDIIVPLPLDEYKAQGCKIDLGEIKPGQLAYRVYDQEETVKSTVTRAVIPAVTDEYRLRLNFRCDNPKGSYLLRCGSEKSMIQFSIGIGANAIRTSGAVTQRARVRNKMSSKGIIKTNLYINLAKGEGYFLCSKRTVYFKLKPEFNKVDYFSVTNNSEFFMTDPDVSETDNEIQDDDNAMTN